MINNYKPAFEYEGKSEEETRAFLKTIGCTMRVIERDGYQFISTRDYIATRVNVIIKKGKVTAIHSQG